MSGSSRKECACAGMAPLVMTLRLFFGARTRSSMPAEQGKHYVWVPSETGSHLAGKWIEVDDQAPKTPVGMQGRLRSAGGNVIKRAQDNVTGLNP